MSREVREKKANKPENKTETVKPSTPPKKPKVKKEEPEVRTKTTEGEYIHHDLYINNGWVTSVLGSDPKVLFEVVDKEYYTFRKNIAMGKVRKGTPFKFHILRRVGIESFSVPYIPGSTLGNRFRWRDEEDEDDEEEFDYFGDY